MTLYRQLFQIITFFFSLKYFEIAIYHVATHFLRKNKKIIKKKMFKTYKINKAMYL
jgi:hypothetical protein